jgi:HSP20 family protein
MYDPLAEIETLQSRLMDLFTGGSFGRSDVAGDFPPLNVDNGDGDLVVTAELPGMSFDEIDVSMSGNVLTVRGTRKPEIEAPGKAYYRRERPSGAFCRALQLPERVTGEAAEATYTDGILTVRVPKAPEVKPHRVVVRNP